MFESLLKRIGISKKKAKPKTALIYPGCTVYHTNGVCSSSFDAPQVMSEEEAKAAGYRKCKKCEKHDG